MKLYIVGPVGSGKTTLARQISQVTGVPRFHLDQVAHQRDPAAKIGNRKRSEAQRDAIFRSILARKDYILEDTGRVCFDQGLEEAEQILLLEPPTALRLGRVLRRWIRQNLGLEACAYHPTWRMLRDMFRWTRAYDTGEDGVRARAEQFPHKLTVVRSKGELDQFLSTLPH
ncbi:MAG: hypothetical protein ACOYJZ_00385 [Acutalibacter sp.]|jgi:adenylate kinase family enzyme